MTIWFTPTTTRKLTSNNSARTTSLTAFYVIGDKKDPEYWKGEAAEAIINAYKENLNSKGFTYTDNKDAADLGIQVSYVQSTYYFTDYGQPEWWWNYPGYWDAPYWGNWGGWYYPYVVNYSITTNSFLTEIMNLKAPEGEKQNSPFCGAAS